MKSISARIAQVALFLATASLAFNASAAPTVKIDGVRQNFPWSNAVEINYSVTDCETGSANNYALRFVVAKGGETTDITAAVGAPLVTNTAAGKVVWDAPADFASTPADVTLSVSVVDTPFDGDLSKLVGDYEVRDGQTLFGALAGNYKITIADGATVTLSNAVVTSLADDAGFAGLTCLGDATIVLAGTDTNIVNGTFGYSGIFVPTNHTLTIQGDGALVATGGDYGAGIGSGQNSDCGNITISGGTVIANGGMAAAGIGSGYNGSTCGNVTISGGTVIANGGMAAAGIGSGYNGSTCGNVTISGGTVIATGGYEGAGIGSGFSDSVCGDITISGGTVIATGGKKAAGIGSGFDNSTCGGITIGAGIVKVVATGGGNGAEIIGSGDRASCGTVTIDPETVERMDGDTRTILPKTVDLSTLAGGYEAQNGQTLTGTLAGSHKLTIAAGATVTLSNAVITSLANATDCAGLTCLGNATIVLAGSDTNVVNGAIDNPGIFVPTNCTLTIQGDGALAAAGGEDAAGIGGGYKTSACGNISISSGTIVATGGKNSAGIGSGRKSACGDITISGGTVEATGGEDAAGIGSGRKSACGDITISGGTVEATGGKYAAGIGSGSDSTCGNITIGADIVKVVATRGGSSAESIGKGNSGTCGTVTVDPETIDQTDGDTRTILPKRIDLSTLTGDYEVRDGQTLFGALAGSYKITIADGATVTLSNAVVTSLADDAGFAGLTCLGEATLVLAGSDTNIVKGAKGVEMGTAGHPGIFVPAGRTLTIQGDGALAATGGYNAAGIGGGSGAYGNCGNIDIRSGTIVATGGNYYGSGIGGSICAHIYIRGGTVVAKGGEMGIGIGGGEADIEIGAGVVKVIATSGGGYGAESIKGKYVTIADPSKVTQN